MITDRQVTIDIHGQENRYDLTYRRKSYAFPTLKNMQDFFLREMPFDTLKVIHGGKRSYYHLSDSCIEVYTSKRSLREALNQESGGAWCEEKEGKKRYFVEKRGWFTSSIKEVSKEQCYLEESVLQKALGIGLSFLSLTPGIMECANHLPFETRAVITGALALQERSALIGLISFQSFITSVRAQSTTNNTEFQVNNYTANFQRFPDVAGLGQGGFVVVWQSRNQDGDLEGVYGQIFEGNGSRVQGEFPINNFTVNSQTNPKVSPLDEGQFVVTWGSELQDGDSTGVYAQIFALNGSKLYSEFRVNNYTISAQANPSIATLDDGDFVIVWNSFGQISGADEVYGQRFLADSTTVNSEFLVNNFTSGNQNRPSIASLSSGGFVIVWMSEGQDGGAEGIYAKIYNRFGTKIGPEFLVNNFTQNSQIGPDVAFLTNGGFVVVWQSMLQDGSSWGIFGHRFDAIGNPLDGEFQVNTYNISQQSSPKVASLLSGSFVIVWESDEQEGNSAEVYGQRYALNGTRLGGEFRINTHIPDRQLNPAIAALQDGGFVVIWTSNLQDGFSEGIFGQRFSEFGEPIHLETTEISTSSMSSRIGIQSFSTQFANESFSSTLTSNHSSTVSFTETEQTSLENQSLSASTLSSSSLIESSMTAGLLTLSVIEYGTSYPIAINGNVIGSFYLTGGTGSYQSGNMNMIVIELSEDYVPEEGDSVLLFTDVLDEDLVLAGDFTLNREDCIAAQGEVRDGDYYLVFDIISSCMTATEGRELKALPLTLLSY